MSKSWDILSPAEGARGDLSPGLAIQATHVPWLRESFAILPPDGLIRAFSGTRTWHRLAAAFRAVGFVDLHPEAWSHSQGFPKSRDISKEMDRMAGAVTASPDAVTWDGYGTALRPAWEPIVTARRPGINDKRSLSSRVVHVLRKPIAEGTVAENCLAHGAGALNLKAAYVKRDGISVGGGGKLWSHYRDGTEERAKPNAEGNAPGWPANLVLVHTAECKPTGGTLLTPSVIRPKTRGVGTRLAGLERHVGQQFEAKVAWLEREEVWDCPPTCPVRRMDANGVKSVGFHRFTPG